MDAKEFEGKLTKIRDTAKAQMTGNYTTESDAYTALNLLGQLCDLMLDIKDSEPPKNPMSMDDYQKAVSSGGHSMHPNAPCPVCGDMDGCHEPARLKDAR